MLYNGPKLNLMHSPVYFGKNKYSFRMQAFMIATSSRCKIRHLSHKICNIAIEVNNIDRMANREDEKFPQNVAQPR